MKIFRDPKSPKGQMFLLPLSVDEFIAKDSKARIIGDIIDCLSCDEFYEKYLGGGSPAYDPKMMLKILVFGYEVGIRSSRKIAAAAEQDLRFMYLCEMSDPSYRSIARFRAGNLELIKKLFKKTVESSKELGLVMLEHVSIDGTKLEANVSREETYSKARVDRSLERINEKIDKIMEEAQTADDAEDAEYGDKRGDEIPEELKDANARKERLEQIKKELEESGKQTIAFTDKDSRVMKTRQGNKPAYNGQVAVDGKSQIIIAASVTQNENDYGQAIEILEQAEANAGGKPEIVTADGGYYTAQTLRDLEDHDINAYIPDSRTNKESDSPEYRYDSENNEYVCPAGKILRFSRERTVKGLEYLIYRCSQCQGCKMIDKCKPTGRRPVKELYIRKNYEPEERMRSKMETDEGKFIYRLRKQIVEPVFGNIKWNKGIRRLLLRGLKGAQIEFNLACACHNIGKLCQIWGKTPVNAIR